MAFPSDWRSRPGQPTFQPFFVAAVEVLGRAMQAGWLISVSCTLHFPLQLQFPSLLRRRSGRSHAMLPAPTRVSIAWLRSERLRKRLTVPQSSQNFLIAGFYLLFCVIWYLFSISIFVFHSLISAFYFLRPVFGFLFSVFSTHHIDN